MKLRLLKSGLFYAEMYFKVLVFNVDISGRDFRLVFHRVVLKTNFALFAYTDKKTVNIIVLILNLVIYFK
jgi:hypothetical protein